MKTSDEITLITPTGGRPDSLSRCFEYVRRFNWNGVKQWIIIDDCVPHSIEGAFLPHTLLTVMHPAPYWRPGGNTLARNILVALPEVMFDRIVFIEDDDWYAPDYLEVVAERLDSNILVGEKHAHYYHIPTRSYRVMPNVRHASLCQTAIRRECLPKLTEVCHKSPHYIDVRLWEAVPQGQLYDTHLCIGIKGLPGRPGIGIGHRPEPGDWTPDPWKEMLCTWIGEDTARYYGRSAAATPLRPV